MRDKRREHSLSSDNAVEALLEQASARPMPPVDDTEAIRDVVRAEWRRVTGQRRARQRWARLAIAASVLAALFLSLNLLRTTNVEFPEVASVDRQLGTLRVLGENSELRSHTDMTSIVAGQTLVTGDNSGLGLSWNSGGSLRLDADTRVEFRSPERIYLHAGRVYFDSEPSLVGIVAGADARLTIETDFGEVSHVGTQYMAGADRERLTVSVREGAVTVENAGGIVTARTRQQLAISGRGPHSVVSIPSHGDAWAWVEQMAPPVALEGRSLDEFLRWVGHETGLEVRYATVETRTFAQREILNGTLEASPREALEAWMMGTDLGWRIEEGVIYVENAQ